MNIMKDVILNIVLILFPIIVYFIYNCYRELKCEKYNSILLNVALFSSLYLSLKYGNIENNTRILLFCNIPIVVAYLIKKDIFDGFELEKKFSFEEFLQENYKTLRIETKVFNRYFIDIGIPEDYERFVNTRS